MIGVVGHWENPDWIYKNDKISGYAQKHILRMWSYALKSFNVKNFILIDLDNTDPYYGDAEINFQKFNSLEEVMKKYENYKFVILMQEHNIPKNFKKTKLKDFKHPKDNVFYVIGPNYTDLKTDNLKKCEYVYIPTTRKGLLWDVLVVPIILYDRFTKYGTDSIR